MRSSKLLKTYLRNQHLVAGLHARRDPLALLVDGARADSQHLGLVELLDGAVGEEDAGCGLGLGLDALDEDAVEEGRDAADGLDGGLFGCVLVMDICEVRDDLEVNGSMDGWGLVL